MSFLGCCEICDDADPRWSVTRIGDVATTWACDDHLSQVAGRLQRDREITELSVRDRRKLLEWAAITRSLEAIATGRGAP